MKHSLFSLLLLVFCQGCVQDPQGVTKEGAVTYNFLPLPNPVPTFIAMNWGKVRSNYSANSAHLEEGQSIAWGHAVLSSNEKIGWIMNKSNDQIAFIINYSFSTTEIDKLSNQGWELKQKGKDEAGPFSTFIKKSVAKTPQSALDNVKKTIKPIGKFQTVQAVQLVIRE